MMWLICLKEKRNIVVTLCLKYCWMLSEEGDLHNYTPPQNAVLGGYTVFSLSEIPKFRDSVIPSTFQGF